MSAPHPRHQTRLRTLTVGLALPLVITATRATEHSVVEPFTWSGAHAATIAAQQPVNEMAFGKGHDCSVPHELDTSFASTVWWNRDVWDARGDTAFPAITNPPATGYHVDVHKAMTADPTDGREDNTVYAVGGDGSPGVAAMRLDFQGISSARLRNPMLIAADRPGVIRFYTTRFLTTAFWWEIALTPTATVAGAEHTAVPSVEDPLDGPFANSAGTPGPGHRPAVDSINVIGTGSADDPCSDGWSVRFAVTRSLGGTTTDVFNPIGSLEELMPTDPAELEELYLWQIEVWPDHIDLAADLDRNGTPEPVESFAVSVPWSEVYVHFMSVAYQADHHPQQPCYLGQIREFVWRNLTVSPVKYERTLTFPRESGTANLPRTSGWLGYDLRDIQRHGPAVSGIPQANPEPFDAWTSLLACSTPAIFYCPNPTPQLALAVDLPAADLVGLARAQLVYDIRSGSGGAGVATLTVNGTLVGTLPHHASVAAATSQEWVHRSLDIPPALLHAGSNSVTIAMSGATELDRLQLELAITDAVFADGFETGNTARWSAVVP